MSGNAICFGGSIFSTLLFLYALSKGKPEDILFHALITAIQWGIFYSTLK
mgnify:FL=1